MKMKYTLQKLLQILKIRLKMLTIRQRQLVELETFFGRHETPCWNAMQNLKIKFDMLRQACDAKNKTTQQRTRILR